MTGEPIDVTTFGETPGAHMLVLDKGYVRLVEAWGSDQRIVEAARMSTGKGFQGWGGRQWICPECGLAAHEGAYREGTRPTCARIGHPEVALELKDKPGDERLLRYLWTKKHTTPFEMAGATFEVQAPLFVFREWHRHRTQSYNEASARYAPLPAIDYVPDVQNITERVLQATANKQAQAHVASVQRLTGIAAAAWVGSLQSWQAEGEALYQEGLRIGIPKELARLAMTTGRYSKMRASANLLNWTRFLRLRLDASAQWEIRQYAIAITHALVPVFPRVMELFAEELEG